MSTRKVTRKAPRKRTAKKVVVVEKAPARRRRPAVTRAVVPSQSIEYDSPSGGLKEAVKFKSAGGALGAHAGEVLGNWIGHGVEKVVQALSGFGDYHIMENSVAQGTIGGDPPVVRNTPYGMIIRHREYIADVFAAIAFTNKQYHINPGQLPSFPWLSQVADSFEQYRFRGLVFEFKSMSSDAILSTSSSSALGTVIMATQYNSLDAPFTDKRTMENYEFANSTKPSCNLLHPVECKRGETSISELYVRTTDQFTGDLRLYDLGVFNLAVQGMQNAANNEVVGELWATFEIEFYKPKLLPLGGNDGLTDHFQILDASGANFFKLGQLTSGSTIGGAFVNSTYTFPPNITSGVFMVTYYVQGTVPGGAGTSITPAVGSLVNCTLLTILTGAASIEFAPTANTLNNTQDMFQFIIEINQTNPSSQAAFTLSVAAGVFLVAPVTGDCIVALLSQSIN